MKTEKRMVCFIAAAVLLILTLWFTSCGATTAEAGAERKPCYHVTVAWLSFSSCLGRS